MTDFQASAVIAKPVDLVFSYMVNLRNAPEYMKAVVETNKITDGSIGVGTKYQETRKVRGKKAVAEIEFLSFEENVSYKTRSNSNGLIVDYEYEFSEVEEGTKVQFKAKLHVKGLMMKLTKRMLVNILRAEDGDHLQRVKANLEEDSITE
ncbi:SRPBCC family protein [Niallia sp. 01092]|uniref:SRPBCC family protein n=1 Tax=unclassified Niallia TaxID=2837522 RepID=UPI003FD3ABE7